VADMIAAGGNLRRVMLGVPAYDFRVHEVFMTSALMTQVLLLANNIVLDVRAHCGNCHVDDAQNELLAIFLESDCDDLVIVGSDQGWKAEDFLKLLMYDRDIVAGAVIKKQKDEAYTVLISEPEIWADKDGLVEAHTIGSGFLRLTRKVVETLAKKSRVYENNAGQKRFLVFERWIKDGRRWSGDNVVCLKAKAEGFKIYIDPELWSVHVGTNVWTGRVGDYWRSLMKQDAA
jgi:hypothetical protein